MRRIAVLTSGGDAPGMNAAIMAVAMAARKRGMQLVGIKRGYDGALRKSAHVEDDIIELDLDTILDIADQAGTFLRTARCPEFKDLPNQVRAANNLREMGIEGVVVIGGDGSYMGARALCNQGIPCIGIPGTIDNDLAYTEMTLGYDTACNSCMEDVRAIRATSRSHDRPHIVEVMGRHCGDLALRTAAASGAEMCIVPEVPWTIQEISDRLARHVDNGNPRATIVIAEGAWDSLQGNYNWQKLLMENGVRCHIDSVLSTDYLAKVLKVKTKAEIRPTVCGYTQRGRTPTAYDRWFAFEAGTLAVKMLANNLSNQVIGIKDGRVFYMPIDEALATKREFNLPLYEMINGTSDH
ncbi:MAG: ATP-dependent 6-phosphofructokinase [Clostridia bacterium]|nr:ATP-dependent 6-phosphofructokinase [Clostridia bacterium]